MFRENVESLGMRGDELAIDPAVLEQEVSQSMEQDEIGLRLEGDVIGSCHRRLRLARIDDDDAWLVRIAKDALPQSRVSDAEV